MTSGAPFDAVVLVGFGGPEGPDDVMPFLRNVTRGRGVPEERLTEVARQYDHFGGVSPINEQNRALLAALTDELAVRGRSVSTWWGNRNWHPMLADTVADMRDAGVRRAVALTTSAWSSFSSCRQYLDDIDRAVATAAEGAPEVVKARPFFNHPGFVEAAADRLVQAMEGSGLAQAVWGTTGPVRVVCTAHSIPRSMAATCDYEAQLHEAAGLVMTAAARVVGDDAVIPDAEVVFQSRSGPPQVPWLEPDVVDRLAELPGEGVDTVVVVPLGFISDHMEVRHDLDTAAADAAAEVGLGFVRVPTVGTHPRFVAGMVDLLDEYLVGAPPQALGSLGPRPARCEPGCCPPPLRPPIRSGPSSG